MQPEPFSWPDGKRAALSLTFDDARPSQLDEGLPVLDAHNVKASFYVSFRNLEERLEDWRRAARNGHEIGNHTVSHPCSGNFSFARANPLEDYTLQRMDAELTGANETIRQMLGVTPQTFAYPCGQKFVGRGEALRSYVPLVARHFLAGRGFRDETHNDPQFCDPAQLYGMDADDISFSQLKTLMDGALKSGGWLVLVAHDVGRANNFQTIERSVLEEVCRYARDESNGLWIDTVATVASHLDQARIRRARP